MHLPALLQQFITILLLVGAMFFSKPPAPAQQPKLTFAQTAEAEKLFIVHFSTGENWRNDKPANEQKHFEHHSKNLQALRADNKLLLGARYADKGMIIIKAANEAEAMTFVARDSSVINKVFKVELHEFKPFYGGCIEKK
jgi:uncharacterized protein YciI